MYKCRTKKKTRIKQSKIKTRHHVNHNNNLLINRFIFFYYFYCFKERFIEISFILLTTQNTYNVFFFIILTELCCV